MACSVWKEPCAPVMPWQMTRVFLSTRTDMSGEPELQVSGRGLDGGHGLLGGVVEVVGGDDGEARFPQQLLAEGYIGAFETDHERNRQLDLARGGDDAFGDGVAAHDPAEDVDEHALHVGV